jgi:hypothetical protein
MLLASPVSVYAQQDRQLPPVTLDLRDAPVRDALEQLFKSAKVDYSIDPGVAGFVTLKITEQPFENALRLILRSAQIPLTYTKEGGVYLVKIRELVAPPVVNTPTPPERDQQERVYQPLETIQLVYVDPADLSQVIGPITFIQFNVRGQQAGGGGGFGGGGFGGGFGGGGLGGGGFGGGGLGGGLGGGGFGGGGLGGGGFGGGGLGGGFGGGGLGGGGFGGGGLGGGGLGGFGGGGFGGGRGF